MPHVFKIHRESLRRRYAVYVVVIKSAGNIELYVGKVGDNREGCNPLISRCGNHFSYNEIHSQIRNKVADHELRDYIYVFEHFDEYSESPDERRSSIDRINEMERWLNQEVQSLAAKNAGVTLLNPYKGTGFLRKQERIKREGFRTKESETKIHSMVAAVFAVCNE